MLPKLALSLALTSLLILLTACYHVPVPQGNSLTSEEIAGIKPGMTSEQVIEKTGNPVLNNTFKNHQMAYVYSYKKGSEPMSVKRVIVYFKNNKVTRVKIEDDAPTPAAAKHGPA